MDSILKPSDAVVCALAEEIGNALDYETIESVYVGHGKDAGKALACLLEMLVDFGGSATDSSHVKAVSNANVAQKRTATSNGSHSTTSSSNKLIPAFASDYEAYSKLRSDYQSYLSENQISIIWKDVRQTIDNSPNDVIRNRYIVAARRIDEMIEATNPHIKSSSSTDAHTWRDPHYSNFLLICDEILHFSKLEEIWQSIDTSFVGEDRFNIAVMQALESLDNSFEYPELTAESLETQVTSGKRLHSNVGSHKTSLKNSKSSKQRSRAPTVQEMVLDMAKEIFKGTNIPDSVIQEIVVKCNYDFELAIQSILEDYTCKHSIVRDNLTFADAAASLSQSRKGVSSSVLSSNNTFHPAVSFKVEDVASKSAQMTATAATNLNIVTYIGAARKNSKKQSEQYHRFAGHFLSVARSKNPHLRLDLDRDRLLAFLGEKSTSRGRYDSMGIQTISLDLHGLTVLRALELVESTVNHFYRIRSEAPVPGGKLLLKFIVGKGNHSAGGIPKLKPAVEKYLNENGESNLIVFEGEVLLCISS